MKKPKTLIPTEGELGILHVLWRIGPSTVTQVAKYMDRPRTTILTLLQIMYEKGLVTRDESRFAHIYEARQSADQTRQHMLKNVLDRAFEGSTYQMVMKALSMNPVSKKELDDIQKLVSEHKKSKRKL